MYVIFIAQPAQLDEEDCANTHEGRDCCTNQEITMPRAECMLLVPAGQHINGTF
jgi:hypothetical protein